MDFKVDINLFELKSLYGGVVIAKKKKISSVGKPFVTICTPTYNRRTFIPALIKSYENQTYPRELMEWVVVDDGSDSVEDLFKDVDGVKYYSLDKRMSLGCKRNYMHTKASGDIIVYMDDDDYYPPNRVLHAVDKLRSKPNVLMAGSSVMFIHFKGLNKIYKFGPFGENHATAGTFAFKKELLKLTCFDNNATVSEEAFFLKDFTIPMIQLDPKKTILVFSHSQNTFDKRQLLLNPKANSIRETKFTPSVFIKDQELREFYVSQ